MTSSLACIFVSGCLTFALLDTPTDVISIIHTVFCQNTMIVTAALNPDPTLVSLAGTMAPLASVGLFLAPMPTIRRHEGKDCRKLAITASYNNA
jgi:hypothetical protein